MNDLENHFGDDASFEGEDEVLDFCYDILVKTTQINFVRLWRVNLAMKWQLAIAHFLKLPTKICPKIFLKQKKFKARQIAMRATKTLKWDFGGKAGLILIRFAQ